MVETSRVDPVFGEDIPVAFILDINLPVKPLRGSPDVERTNYFLSLSFEVFVKGKRLLFHKWSPM